MSVLTPRWAAGLLLAATSLHATAQTTPAHLQAGALIAEHGNLQGAPACASCHGPQGQGQGIYPPLAGQPAGYLQRQLQALASNQRKHPQMSGIAKALTAQEQADVAAFYASLKLPVQPVQGPLPTAKDGKGAWLAERLQRDLGVGARATGYGGGMRSAG